MIKKDSFFRITFIAFCAFFVLNSCADKKEQTFLEFDQSISRHWMGPEYWGNRLQDWRVSNGRIECLNNHRKMRTIQLLPHFLGDKGETLNMSIRVGSFQLDDQSLQVDHTDEFIITPEAMAGDDTYAGFIIGAAKLTTDYRARALTHRTYGKNGGLLAVIRNNELALLDMEDSLKTLPTETLVKGNIDLNTRNLELQVDIHENNETQVIRLAAIDLETGDVISKIETADYSKKLTGNLGAVTNGSIGNNRMYWFSHWTLSGNKLATNHDQHFGPIISTLYTVHQDILKLTAQLAPVQEDNPGEVLLLAKGTNETEWEEIAKTNVIIPGYTATFRVENWNDEKDTEYRVKYHYKGNNNEKSEAVYDGIIKADPKDRENIVVAAFTGNSPAEAMHGDYNFSQQNIWFPHNDLIPKVAKLNPDLLVYTGDQVYEWLPVQPDKSGGKSSNLDYLYKWYLWCWSHGELSRNIPTVCLLDDHDVYQGNIWGAGGKKTDDPEDGGYVMPAEFVNMAQRTQVSHLPDPYDPTPVEQGIEVFYGSLNWGGIDFAILEDRKFKSGPNTTLPLEVQEKLEKDPYNVDPTLLDVPEAVLMGERQLNFIRDWTTDWENADMKVALCQTIFAGLTTEPTENSDNLSYEPGYYPPNHKIAFSPDANSWPLSKRNKALKELRKGYVFMIGGDTHLGSIIHHGVDNWGDAGYSFCVPSIANRHVRVWFPPYPGKNPIDSLPPYTGEYKDRAGAKMTVHAVSNPYDLDIEPSALYDRAPGFGIIRFNKKEKTITMENWPRFADPEKDNQYPGWPKTISMYDNYSPSAAVTLPAFQVKGLEQPPVIQVIDEANDEIIYTVRMDDFSFEPTVFREGNYTVIFSEPETNRQEEIKNVSTKTTATAPKIIDFSN